MTRHSYCDDRSSLSISEHSWEKHNTEILVTDEKGNKTGFDKTSNRIISKIPRSTFSRDKIGRGSIAINKPARGLYKLTIFALPNFQNGLGSIYIRGNNSNGEFSGGATIGPDTDSDNVEIYYSPDPDAKILIRDSKNQIEIQSDTAVHLLLRDSQGRKLGWQNGRKIIELSGYYEENWCSLNMDDVCESPTLNTLGAWHMGNRDIYTLYIIASTPTLYLVTVKTTTMYSGPNNVIDAKHVFGIVSSGTVQQVKIDFSPFESNTSTFSKIMDIAMLKEEITNACDLGFVNEKRYVDLLMTQINDINQEDSNRTSKRQLDQLIETLNSIKQSDGQKSTYIKPDPVLGPGAPEQWIKENYSHLYNVKINPIDILIEDVKLAYLNLD